MNLLFELAVIAAGAAGLIPVIAAVLAQRQPKPVPVRVRVRRDR